MELTWKVGEKRRGNVLSYRGSANVCVADVTFTVAERHSNEEDYDWRVVDEGGSEWGFCEEWGATITGDTSVSFEVGQHRLMKVPGVHEDRPVLVKIAEINSYTLEVRCLEEACSYHHSSKWGTNYSSDFGAVDINKYDDGVPKAGQIRRTKISHIHGDKDITVRVVKVFSYAQPGDIWGYGQCLDCDTGFHKEQGQGYDWLLTQPSVLVTDFQEPQQELQKQPEPKETDMEIEKRKEWVKTQDWNRFVPTDLIPEKTGQKPMAGEVWRVGYNSDYKAVVLVLGSEALVLCGRLSVYRAGETRDFTGGSLPNRSALLCAADSYELPMLWKKGELLHGPLHATLDSFSAVLVEAATYKVVERHGGSYDWHVELQTGPQKGVRFGASERWRSAVVSEPLMPLMLGSFEPDPDAPATRPKKYVKGDVYLAREEYDEIPGGSLLMVTQSSSDFYFIGGKLDGKERVFGNTVWDKGNMHLQLMRPVGRGRVAVPKADQCGDKSTAYGLTCEMRKEHGGEKHRRGDAEWNVAPVVVKLGKCANSHNDPRTGVAAMAVAEVVVSKGGGKFQLCEPCIVSRDKDAAARMKSHDKNNPQPKHQPRFLVDSQTLDAGGVFTIRG